MPFYDAQKLKVYWSGAVEVRTARRRGEFDRDLQDPQIVELVGLVGHARQLQRHRVLAGVKQSRRNRDRDPFGCLVPRLDMSVQIIDPLAIDRDIGLELTPANLVGIVCVVVFADDLDDVHHDEGGPVGYVGQFECPLEQPSFGQWRVEERRGHGDLVAEVVRGRVDDESAPFPEHDQLAQAIARDRQHARIGRCQLERLVGKRR